MTVDEPLRRCDWVGAATDYLDYHDQEWGVPTHGERALFERISLEAFQSGLSWITVLRKRPAFRAAFADFEPAAVADFGPDDVDQLLTDTGIIRNRAKIAACIGNARATLQLPMPLDELLWRFAPAGPRRRPRTAAEVPAATDASRALADTLKGYGFRFVGPTTAYALMQATGMVDDHLAGCWRAVAADSRAAVPAPPEISSVGPSADFC